MEKYKFQFLVAFMIAGLMGCGDAQQNAHQNNSLDTSTSNPTSTKKTDMITQKITPCLWVDK